MSTTEEQQGGHHAARERLTGSEVTERGGEPGCADSLAPGQTFRSAGDGPSPVSPKQKCGHL